MSFGFVGSRAVVLDLAADRYFLLGAQESRALSSFCASPGDHMPLALIEALVARGFLAPGSGAPIAPVGMLSPRTSALESGSAGEVVRLSEVFFGRLGAAITLRVRGLAATIAHWRTLASRAELLREKGGGSSDEEDRAAGIARGYAETRLLVPAPRLCVPDSLALMRCLWRRGIAADLLFGVRLQPFSAHCWVQKGDLLLSDPLDIVADYSPVFRL